MNPFKDDATLPPESPNSPSQTPTASPPNRTWSFGTFMNSLTTKSEHVIETYRKNFQEFGSELRKETTIIRDVASHAVNVLPTSFDASASVAQESLENVGQAIDDIGATVWKSTAQIISHGRDTFMGVDRGHDRSISSSYNNINNNSSTRDQLSMEMDMKRYSRFEMQMHALQCDLDTYCTVPADEVEYEKWRSNCFILEEKKEEIESIRENNRVVKEVFHKVVPNKVDNESFWSRYFYRTHKLKQADEARSLLVKRAITNDDEDLTWDLDDEDETGEGSLSKGEPSSGGNGEVVNHSVGKNATDRSGDGDKNVEEKGKHGGGLSKDGHGSVVSSHQCEGDLGWDEIEDVGSNGSKGNQVGSGVRAGRVDLQILLSAAGEEEDLTWDVEDDDSAVKHGHK